MFHVPEFFQVPVQPHLLENTNVLVVSVQETCIQCEIVHESYNLLNITLHQEVKQRPNRSVVIFHAHRTWTKHATKFMGHKLTYS